MIFHSLSFVVFFVVVVTVYWRLPHRWQNVFLLGASYLFYGWIQPWFVLAMLASTTVDFWAGQRMEDDPARKKRYLWASLSVNLGMLAFCFPILHRERARRARHARITVGLPTLRSCRRWHLVLHVPGAQHTIDVYGARCARAAPIDFALRRVFRTWSPDRSCARRTCSCRWSGRASSCPMRRAVAWS